MYNKFMDKKYLILSGVFLLFVIFILFLIFSNKTNQNLENNKAVISPFQKIKINDKNYPTNPPTIPPQDFTGVKEEELPKDIKDYSNQKLSLMKKLPIKTSYFSIDFDYVEDKFTISYQEPKPTSKDIFSSWLSQNYPALKVEDFLEK